MAALATVAGLTACSSDEETAQVLTDTPMSISAGINNLSTRAGYDSNADLQTGSFGLFLSTAGSESTETNYAKYNTENMQFTYADDAWTGTSQLLWKSSNNANAVDYAAYMPYDADMTLTSGAAGTAAAPTAYEFTVKDDQSTDANVQASDLLYYSRSGFTQPIDNAIGIAFDHKLSKLNVELTLGTELEQSGVSFTTTSVTLSSATTNTTINLQTGELTAATTAATSDITLFDASSEIDKTATSYPDYLYQCVIVPQSLTLKITIVGDYTTTDSDGNTTTVSKTFEWTGSADETFASGNEYTLKLNVGRDVVENGKITAVAWSANNSDGTDGDLETK